MNSGTSKFNTLINNISTSKWIIPAILLILAFFITVQSIGTGATHFLWGRNYTHYNNYVIFKHSFSHLIENKNLYDFYVGQYADLYKYSPTFAFFMAPFYWLSDAAGLFIWNALNMLVLYYALSKLTIIDAKQKLLLLLFIMFEFILSTQNSQSNALLAGLTILSFNLFEKGKFWHASLFIALGFYIKIYSILACLLIFFYPKKFKSIGILAVCFIVLFLLPLLAIDFSDLITQYKNWYELLKMDQDESIGMSAFLFMNNLFPTNVAKLLTLGIGLIMLITPLFLRKNHENSIFRTMYLALILIWMVIFNHKAESPTFIIAVCGVGIWYFVSEKNVFHKILLFGTLICTSLWFTDIVPKPVKMIFPDLRYVKTLFPMLILIVIFVQLVFLKSIAKNQTN